MSSLRGRYYGDCLKLWVLRKLNYTLPTPPYSLPEYWDHAYKDFTEYEKPIEWGNITFQHLKEYKYRVLNHNNGSRKASSSLFLDITRASSSYKTTLDPNPNPELCTTLHETLLGTLSPTHPEHERKNPEYNDEDDDPLLILGCGNSQLGFHVLDSGLYKGPIIQIDASARIVSVMATLYNPQIQSGDMMIIQDDACQLSSLSKANSIAACIDKGLLDSFICAGHGKSMSATSEEHEKCVNIFRSVHRVLRPNGFFCVWSYAQPEFLLPFFESQQRNHKNSSDTGGHQMWRQLEIRHDITNDVLLYRFQKAPTTNAMKPHKKQTQSKPTRNRHSPPIDPSRI